MTLYTYVPGKAELLDLMLDAAYQRMPRAGTAGQPWRQRVTAIAAENRALFEAHPWAAAISTARPPLGPGLMAKYEHELSALDGLGLTDIQMDAALTHLLTFVQAWARAAAEQATRQDTAMDEEHGGRPARPCLNGSSTRAPTHWPPASEPRRAPPTAPPTARGTPTTSACGPSWTACAALIDPPR